MGNAVFPNLPGLNWGVTKNPTYSSRVHRSVNGMEARAALMAYPLWEFGLSYEVLRDGNYGTELSQLMAFIMQRQGQFDSFLYTDPWDNSVTAQQFATGDGITTTFQLYRSLGGFIEPTENINGAPVIYRTNWAGRNLLYPTARTNMSIYSQQIDQWTSLPNFGAWGLAACTPDVWTAPDGTLTGDRVVISAIATGRMITVPVVAGQTYVFSYYAGSVAVNGDAVSKVSTGLNGTLVAEIKNVAIVPNSRNAVSFTIPATGVNQVSIGVGTYTSTSGNIDMWGVQMETGTTPTPYFMTQAAPVTLTDYTVGSTGIVTPNPVLASGATLDWTGNFYYRCRFNSDSNEFAQMMRGLWEMKKLAFVGSPMNKVGL